MAGLEGWNETHQDVQWLTCPFTQRRFPCDSGIVEDVQRLWAAGVQTFNACQGEPDPWSMTARYIQVRGADLERAQVLLPWAVHRGKIDHLGYGSLRDRHAIVVGQLKHNAPPWGEMVTYQWALVDAAFCGC